MRGDADRRNDGPQASEQQAAENQAFESQGTDQQAAENQAFEPQRTEQQAAESQGFKHQSVLYEETIEALRIKPDGVYVDGTTGGAGHSRGILAKLGAGGRLYCLDRDEEALAAAKKRLEEVESEGRWILVHSVYSDFAKVLESYGEEAVDGILLDLGVSSWQLDRAERGFSYREDGPLDMRMDQSQGESARELLARVSQAELERILREYGEERNSKRIAGAIIRERELHGTPETTTRLAEIIVQAQPAKSRREKGHPAKRSFQAIRIAVNGELAQLETFLNQAVEYLAPGGVLAIISFHSLEDRIVKQAFRKWENPCECPPGLPCVCDKEPLGRAVPRNGILPGEDEQMLNPRAHSARLRVFLREDKVQ